MNTVILLSNDYVAALEAAEKDGKFLISRVCSAQAPEGSIINGTVTDPEEFDLFFQEFWKQNHFSGKNVTLVLGSARAVSRQLMLPEMSHTRRMEYLRKEFAEMGRNRDPVLSYVKIGQEDDMERMVVNLVNRSFLQDHIQRFEKRKLRLKSVVMASTADIMLFGQCSCLRGKTCVLQILDGMSVLNLLFVDGMYFHMNRHRLLSERNTPEFGTECANCISNLQRFLDTQFQNREISRVYLMGEFGDKDFDCCQACMQKLMPWLEAERMKPEVCERIRFERKADAEQWIKCSALLGALFVSGRKNNLLYQYHHDPIQEKIKSRKFCKIAAAGIVTLVLGVQVAGQTILWFQNQETAEKQRALFLEVSEKAGISEYDWLQEQVGELKERGNRMDQYLEKLQNTPEYRIEADEAVRACAGDDADARIQSFDGTKGTIVIHVTANREEEVHQFAEALRQKKELFSGVSYDGFTWEQREGVWTADMKAYLR